MRSRCKSARSRCVSEFPHPTGSIKAPFVVVALENGAVTAAAFRPGHPRLRLRSLSAEEVDQYLRRIEEPKRSTLEALRRAILEVVPDAEHMISYGVPAFRVRGKTVAGFA